jgi:peptidoglycan/LPS O-acetylase OafA/YrhL
VQNITHQNNFNALRLLFATLVVFSHSFALLGYEEPALWGRSLGNLSVHGFFALSGYLICQSYVNSSSLFSFTASRILRIAPAFIFAMLISRFLVKLCDGYQANAVPYIANGPIWTLTWEIVCYIALATLGLLGILRTTTIPSFFAAVWLIYLINISSTSITYIVIVPMVLMFLVGAFIFLIEEQINYKKTGIAMIVALVVITNTVFFQKVDAAIRSHIVFLWGTPFTFEQVSRIIYLVAFPVVVIYLGKHVRTVFMLKTDISYGVYIYGWPVAQVIAYLSIQQHSQLNPLLYFALTMLVTIPLAYVSWKVIEKPTLSLKKHLK